MADTRHRITEFLRDPKKKRAGFAGVLAGFAEAKAGLEGGKVFNKETNRFELPSAAKAKLGTSKPPKQRRATILSNVSTKEAKSASVKRRRGSVVRSASLLRRIGSGADKPNRLG